MTEKSASPEVSYPLATLRRLKGSDPQVLERLSLRGDFRTRALALSALGVAIREDPSAFGPVTRKHRLAGRFPFLRAFLKTVGPRGAAVRAPLFNRVSDRVWLVRVAAALGLGECRDPILAERLLPLLEDPYRPVRIAGAAALAACGSGLEAPSLLGAEPTPRMIGDTESSEEWLLFLAAEHVGVLEKWLEIPGAARPSGEDAQAWSGFLLGEPREEPKDPKEAEILRYAQEKEHYHNVTKPFTPGNREQNLQFLHAFLAIAENMRAPQGGRVLDLGGGAAWVSDLLIKLGYRPYTLDIASSLLKVGLDRFTREHQTPRFVLADMARLPFARDSFDAVVVIDALHHCPEVASVFKEAHRVLVSGGQFLLAEPGEGHAESPRSRRENLEHSICEREIHLPEVVRYAREAGFKSVEVVPHFVPSLRMEPEDLEEAKETPSEKWRARRGGDRVAVDEYLLQSTLGNPILVAGKGDRVLDSRMPRLLRARLEADLARDGDTLSGQVRVKNEGDTVWLKGGDERGRVRLGLQLLRPDRSLLNLDFARVELPRDLRPGEGATLPVSLRLPGQDSYILKLDMVDERLCWFEDTGSRPLYLSL